MLWKEVDQPQMGYGTFSLHSEFNFSSDYSKPNIDLSMNHLNLERIGFSSTNGKYFTTFLNNTLSPEYRINWEIHGKINNNVDLTIPDIDDYLIDLENEYDSERTTIRSTSIYKTNLNWNYNQFILFNIETTTRFNIPSSIDYVRLYH